MPSQVNFELDTVTIPCSPSDLKATFGWLLLEMRSVAKILRPDERALLRKVMAHTGERLTVHDLFPDFAREGEGHKTLRRLRASQFLYPARTGRWEPDEPIAVTPFARIAWDRVGEERIFSEPKTKPVSTDTRTPPPNAQKVVTWDNLLECLRERQKAATSAPAGQG